MSEQAEKFGFTLKATDGMARRGRLTTAWGAVETPVFMPVGTAATVKGMMPDSVKSTVPASFWQIPIILCFAPEPNVLHGLAGFAK